MNRAATDFLLLSAIWGSSFLFTRLAVVEFGPVPTAFARVAIAAAFLMPLLLWRGQLAGLRRHWRGTLAIGALNSGLPFALFAFSLLAITSGLSAILNATVPLFGALVAWAWLGDRPARTRVLGLVIGFAGVALLASEKASFTPTASGVAPGWAVLACLGACVCYAIAASATQRHLTGVPPLVMATGSQIGATLSLLPLALWLLPAQAPSLNAWLAVGMLGVMCTGLAYVLYFRLLERIGAQRALTVTFVVPVFAVVYGAAFLREPVTGWMLACGAVIILGTTLATGFWQPRLPGRSAARLRSR